MKLKSHVCFWSFVVFVTYLIVFTYFSAFTTTILGFMGVVAFIYVLSIIIGRRKKSRPEPKKEEWVCCRRCSGEEPWPGDMT